MKNLLLVIVASALVSLTPFIILFDKNCFPNHGIICFSVFLILLCFTNIKAKIKNANQQKILYTITYVLVVAISWIDMQSILNLLQKNTGVYGIIPFITAAIALIILKDSAAMQFKKINLIAFSIFFIHLISCYSFLNQPILDFTLLKQIEFKSEKYSIDRSNLSKDYKKEFLISDSTTITKFYLDTTKTNVIILVESWGIPIDITQFKAQLATFEDLNILVGIHRRSFSHTKKAEREDLIWKVTIDSTKKADTSFITEFLETNEFNTKIFAQNKQLKDSIAILQISDFLDSCLNRKCLVMLTTANTHFPIQGSIIEPNNSYTSELQSTLNSIVFLIKKHPEVNFILQGDHEPILSPIDFQNKFYKRWVPFVIFNSKQ